MTQKKIQIIIVKQNTLNITGNPSLPSETIAWPSHPHIHPVSSSPVLKAVVFVLFWFFFFFGLSNVWYFFHIFFFPQTVVFSSFRQKLSSAFSIAQFVSLTTITIIILNLISCGKTNIWYGKVYTQ